VDYYNLDVIISVGYRVKSQRGVKFRIWATSILKEYMKKGFAMDDDRLKGQAEATIGENYLIESGIFVLLKRYFIGRCLTYIQQALIIILIVMNPLSSLK